MADLKKTDFSAFFDEDNMMTELKKQDGTKFWRPIAGKNTIRILPPNSKNGEKVHYFTHKVHWINKRPYECLDQTMVDKDGNVHERETCPICEVASKLRASKLESEQNISKEICAKYKYISRILARDSDEYKTTPVFYELGSKINKKIINLIQEGEWGSIVGIVDGRDFNLVKEGTGRMTSYDNSNLKPNLSPILSTAEEIVAVLNKTTEMNYNSLISFQPASVLQNAVLGVEGVSEALGIKTQVKNDFLSSLKGAQLDTSISNKAPILEDEGYTLEGEYDTVKKEADFNIDDVSMSDLDSMLSQLKQNS